MAAPRAILFDEASTPASAAGPAPLVWWLHIPKCGSSFKASVNMYTTDPARGGGTHAIFPADASAEEVGEVVTMFRAPKQRLMSMFEYMRRDVTFNAQGKPEFYGAGLSWGWNGSERQRVRMAIYNNGSIADTLGPFIGCQANAVLGHRCLGRVDYGMPPEEVAKRAIERLKRFRFYGLESEWTLSICLFNYLMSGKRYVTRGQLVNTRPNDVAAAAASVYNETGVPDDPIDDPLYEYVEASFHEQLRTHGISEEACPDYTDGVPEAARFDSMANSLRVLPRAAGPPMRSADFEET